MMKILLVTVFCIVFSFEYSIGQKTNGQNCNCQKWNDDYFVGYSNVPNPNNCKSFCQELYYYLCLNQCEQGNAAWNHKAALLQKHQAYAKEYTCDCAGLIGDYFVPEQNEDTGLSKIKRNSLDKFASDFQQIQFPDYILPEEWESGGYSMSIYEANDGNMEMDAVTAFNVTLAGVQKSFEKGELDADAVIGGVSLLSMAGEKISANVKLNKRKKEAAFHHQMAEKWDEYLKKENYETILNSMLDEEVPEYEDFEEPHFYFFIVEQSKFRLAFTKPFELKTDNDGRFLISDEALKQQIKSKGYKRFWLQGSYFDEASAIEFGDLLNDIFKANGLKLQKDIRFRLKPNSIAHTTSPKQKPDKVKPRTTTQPLQQESKPPKKEKIKKSKPSLLKAETSLSKKKGEMPEKTEIKEPIKTAPPATKPMLGKSPTPRKQPLTKEVHSLKDFLDAKGYPYGEPIVVEDIILNYKDENGNSLIHSLMGNNQFYLFRKVLGKTASATIINDVNSDDKTVLHLACELGNYQIADYINYRNPDLNAQDKNGWTALHYAIQNGNINIIQLLMRYRADTSIENNEGLDVIRFAKKYSSKEIFKLLKK